MKRVYIDEFGWQYAFLRGAVKTLRDMLLTYDPKRELFLLAETDIGPVGVMFLKRKSDRIAFLRWLTVTREVRNRGLGKALIECAVGFSRHAGYDSLDLVTVDRLTHAREFYRHQGFIETDRRRDTVWEMDMELCFFTRDLREEAKPSADGTAEKSPAEA
ncbi:MAG: GNAT family N-acetyltransferase [Deltaproteobacteria bacterium]|nr:GNAT family N-acetyltransferase [Candidatus Zymogenaceae bacterium]